MLVRRMGQRNRAEQEKQRMTKEAMREAAEGAPMTASMKLEQELAKKDTAMLDLQRRVEGELDWCRLGSARVKVCVASESSETHGI